MASFAFRRRDFQVDAQYASKDDGRYTGLRAGFTSYNDDGTYERSYVELGGRSDHLYRIGCQILTENDVPMLRQDSPLDIDKDIFRAKPEVSKEALELATAKMTVLNNAVVTDQPLPAVG